MLQIRFQKGLSNATAFGLQTRHACAKSFRSSQTNIRNISFANNYLVPNGSKSSIVQNLNKTNTMNRRLFADDNNKDADTKRFSMVLLGEAVNASDFKVKIPENVLVVPSKRPLYPQSWFPLEFTDVDYMKQLRSHIDRQPLVGIFVAKEGNEKGLSDTSQVEQIGVLSYALNFQQAYQFFYFHALTRIKIVGTPDPNNPLLAKVEEVKDEPYKEDKEFKALYSELIDSFNALVKMQDTGQGYPQHYFQPHQSVNTMKPSQATDLAAGRCINATKEELLVKNSES